MNRIRPLLRRSRALPAVAAAAAAAITTAVLVVPGTAEAHHPGPPARAVPAPPTNPTSAGQIQNVDQVKTAIKAYYGDTTTTAVDPVNGTTVLHEPSATSAYAKEMAGIEKTASSYLAHAGSWHKKSSGKKAIVLDVDDTSVVTYDYEIYSNFVYNPTSNAAFVNAGFPATPGVPALVQKAKAEGYTIFFLTGRPISQAAATEANLTKVGYPVVNSQVYTKDVTSPVLAPCGGSACTTDQYKSLTRKYIESKGYDIVANFGDQYSDLSLGYEDRAFKLPNPMYFLP